MGWNLIKNGSDIQQVGEGKRTPDAQIGKPSVIIDDPPSKTYGAPDAQLCHSSCSICLRCCKLYREILPG